MKKCQKCGSNTFIVQEILLHEASFCENKGSLNVYKDRMCEIDRIFCKGCEKEYLISDFKEINFQ